MLCHKSLGEMASKVIVSEVKVYLRPSGKSSEKRALDLTIWQVFGDVGKSSCCKAVGWKPDQVEE